MRRVQQRRRRLPLAGPAGDLRWCAACGQLSVGRFPHGSRQRPAGQTRLQPWPTQILIPVCLTLTTRRYRRSHTAVSLGKGEAIDPGADGRASASPASVANTLGAVSCAEQWRSRALLPSVSAAGSPSRSSQLLISGEQDGPVAAGQSQIGGVLHTALVVERWLNGHDRRTDPPAAGAWADFDQQPGLLLHAAVILGRAFPLTSRS